MREVAVEHDLSNLMASAHLQARVLQTDDHSRTCRRNYFYDTSRADDCSTDDHDTINSTAAKRNSRVALRTVRLGLWLVLTPQGPNDCHPVRTQDPRLHMHHLVPSLLPHELHLRNSFPDASIIAPPLPEI